MDLVEGLRGLATCDHDDVTFADQAADSLLRLRAVVRSELHALCRQREIMQQYQTYVHAPARDIDRRISLLEDALRE